MPRFYLWAQVWPWFRHSFPFDQFEQLEGDALIGALIAHAHKWASEHEPELAAAEEERGRERRKRVYGRSSDGSRRPVQRPKPSSTQRTFEDIALVAGWAARPCGVVFEYPFLGCLQPIPRVYFFATDSEEDVGGILDALRRLDLQRPLGTGFGDCRTLFRGGIHEERIAPLRLGTVDTASIGRTERVLIARAFEEFSEQPDKFTRWALPLRAEALRLERVLDDDRRPPPKAGSKKRTGRPRSPDEKFDRQVFEARKAGQTYEVLSNNLRRSIHDLKKAYDRERQRRGRIRTQGEG